MALVRLERGHPVADGGADLVLRGSLLLRLGEHVGCERAGTTTTPSSSPTTQSPGSTRTAPIVTGTCVASSSQRHVESSGVTCEQKTGKATLPDEAHVPAAAVENTARDAAGGERGHGELAQMGRDVLPACVDGHVAGGYVAEHRQHLSQRVVPFGRGRGPAPDGERRAGEPRAERSGRIDGGSVCVRRPRSSRMSASAAV